MIYIFDAPSVFLFKIFSIFSIAHFPFTWLWIFHHFVSFFYLFARFFRARTHGAPLQQVIGESLALSRACLASQMTRLLQRLALQAAPMK
jgi:hypothetical protein